MSSSSFSASQHSATPNNDNLAGQEWETVCLTDDLIKGSGICVLFEHQQVAIFYIGNPPNAYAIANFDPFSEANVLSRGITGSMKDKLVVASPIFKQHFCLETGICLEDESFSIATFPVRIEGEHVLLMHS